MPRRKYKNPPIQEALCAFHFVPDDQWNVMYPALLYEKVREEYSGKAREQKLINLEPNPKAVQGATSTAMTVNEVTRTQFVTPDEKKILGTYKDHISISVMRPYPGWEVFRPSIEKALATFRQVAAPKGIRRIGLRYINQLQLDGDLSRLLKCFTYAPTPLAGPDSKIENFTSRYEYLYNDRPIKVAVGFARLVAEAGKVAALLDVDLTWESPGDDPLALDNAMALVDDMRQRERTIFESLITDAARKVFDA